MKVFITGATGYIGSAVAERLLRAGHRLFGLARSGESAARLQLLNIQPVPGNLDDLEALTAAAREADAVVHAAFQLSADVTSSVQAERLSVDALKEGVRGTRKPLLFTSGTAVLGDTGMEVYGEETPISPHSFRGRFDTEQTVRSAGDVHGIVLRPPNVYGRGDGQGLLSVLKAVGSRFGAVPYTTGTANHCWSFVHIDDLAELFALALERSSNGELFHAGAQSGLRTQSIAQAVSRRIGCEGRTVEWPLDQLRSAFPVSALADYWATNNQSSSEKAKTILNWRPGHLDMLGEFAKPQHAA